MKKLNRKWLGLVFAVILIVIGTCLTGCSNSTNSSGGTASKNGKVTLTLWWNVSEGTDIYGYHKMINQYMKENPNIKIVTQSLPYDQLKQKLITAASAGNPPDIAFGLADWISDFTQMGALPDLTNTINSWDQKSHIPNSVWNGVTINNKVVSFPQYIGIRAQLYHSDLLAKAGIKTPPKTWSELITDGVKLKNAGVKYPYGISTDSARGPQELLTYIWSNGLNLVDKESDGKYRNTWTDSPSNLEKATQVFQFYKDLLDKGLITNSEASWTYSDMDQNLANGTVAIAPDGAWMESYEAQNASTMKDIQVSGVPVYNTTPATFLEVAPAFTFAKSPNQKEAIKFLEWMDSKEAQKIYASDRSVRDDVTTPGKWGKDFTNLVKYGKTLPPVPMGGITTVMQQAIQKVLIGGSSSEETAKWLSQQINQSLSDNNLLSSK
jgi:multiple sugar transport system substrate-binding protein